MLQNIWIPERLAIICRQSQFSMPGTRPLGDLDVWGLVTGRSWTPFNLSNPSCRSLHAAQAAALEKDQDPQAAEAKGSHFQFPIGLDMCWPTSWPVRWLLPWFWTRPWDTLLMLHCVMSPLDFVRRWRIYPHGAAELSFERDWEISTGRGWQQFSNLPGISETLQWSLENRIT